MYEYDLDLETLASLLAEVHHSGTLTATLPPGSLRWRLSCQVQINLVEGKIVYCHIEDSDGIIHTMNLDKAFNMLNRLGTLNWKFTINSSETSYSNNTNSSMQKSSSFQTSPHLRSFVPNTGPLRSSAPNTSPQNLNAIVPKVVVNINSQVLNALPRTHRRVLVLIDGTRNIENIINILFPSSKDIKAVVAVLSDLITWGIVTVGDGN